MSVQARTRRGERVGPMRSLVWRRGRLLLLATCLITSWIGLESCPAEAVPIYHFALTSSTTQAGGHPDLTTTFRVGTRSEDYPEPNCHCQDTKDIIINYPTGFIGNPHAVPTCSEVDFSILDCPSDTQVGYAEFSIGGAGEAGENDERAHLLPVYNLEPHPGEAGLLAYYTDLLRSPIFITLTARTDSDYGLAAGHRHTLPKSAPPRSSM